MATVDETALEGLIASGAPTELVEQKRVELQNSVQANQAAIWPENQHACAVFFAMGTQWRINVGLGSARYQGLRYEVLNTVERRIRSDPGVLVPDAATLFRQIQILERAALQHLNADH